MLRVSKMADYAVVIMNALAQATQLSSIQLAQATDISSATVSKLLKKLSTQGLVNATRGPQGGYSLAKPLDHVSIADIVEAIDGPIAMTDCSDQNKACHQAGSCDVKQNWQIINQVVASALGAVSLKDMTKPLNNHPLAINGISFKPVINIKVE